MEYAVPVVPVTSLKIQNTDKLFPVNNVYCVGRNYADHAVEMGHDPNREPPFFFMKPAFAVLPGGGEMEYPSLSSDVHHELELVVALKSGGQDLSVDEASASIFGYGVGIDMTRRDLQGEAKQLGRPWDAGKAFLHSAPCSDLKEMSGALVTEGEIALTVNQETRQQGDINQMIWKIPEIIARLSELFPLSGGDLIYTGTPAGVGPVNPGDKLLATWSDVSLQVSIKS